MKVGFCVEIDRCSRIQLCVDPELRKSIGLGAGSSCERRLICTTKQKPNPACRNHFAGDPKRRELPDRHQGGSYKSVAEMETQAKTKPYL